jgi:hypothetical protein
MNRELPSWPEERETAGRRLAETWEEFFASSERAEEGAGADDLEVEAATVLARHEGWLLRLPNVVGAAVSTRTRGGKPSRERCLVVYVERKVPESELDEGDVLPRELDGIPVDVVEVGRIEPLPS